MLTVEMTPADWLHARLDTLPQADDVTARVDDEDRLVEELETHGFSYATDILYGGTPRHSVVFDGIAAEEETLEKACRTWIRYAKAKAQKDEAVMRAFRDMAPFGARDLVEELVNQIFSAIGRLEIAATSENRNRHTQEPNIYHRWAAECRADLVDLLKD